MPTTRSHYLATCPECGATLQAVVLDPDTPPWVCTICHLGWWVSELQTPVRSEWDSRTRSFHFRSLPALREAITQERATAAVLGTSVRVDQLNLLPLTALQALATKIASKIPPPYTPPPSTLNPNRTPIVATGPLVTFLAQVDAAVKARTVN